MLEELSRLCGNGDEPAVRRMLLSNPAFINKFDQDGNSALLIAARENQLTVAKLLIDMRSEISISDRDGYTPLMYAASEGNYEVAEYLLQCNANVNDVNKNGWTALMFSCCFKQYTLVQLLLQYHAEVNTISLTGCSALYLACKVGDTSIVFALIQACADVNLSSHSGFSPLHIATEQGHLDIVKLLLQSQANPFLCDRTGRQAIDLLATACDHVHAHGLKEGEEDLVLKELYQLLESAMNTTSLNTHHTTITNNSPPKPPKPTRRSATNNNNSSNNNSNKSSNDNDDGNTNGSNRHVYPAVYYDTNNNGLTAAEEATLRALAQTTNLTTWEYAQQNHALAYQQSIDYSYICNSPFFYEYYLQFVRSFTSIVFAFQTLFSEIIPDSRISKIEKLYEIGDNFLQNTLGITGLPILTAIGKKLVAIPFEAERRSQIEEISAYFPTITSHHLIELLAIQLTLLQMNSLKLVLKLSSQSGQTQWDIFYSYANKIPWLLEVVAETRFVLGYAPTSSVDMMVHSPTKPVKPVKPTMQGNTQLITHSTRDNSNKTPITPDIVAKKLTQQQTQSVQLIQGIANLQVGKIVHHLMLWHNNKEAPKRLTEDNLWMLICAALDYEISETSDRKIQEELMISRQHITLDGSTANKVPKLIQPIPVQAVIINEEVKFEGEEMNIKVNGESSQHGETLLSAHENRIQGMEEKFQEYTVMRDQIKQLQSLTQVFQHSLELLEQNQSQQRQQQLQQQYQANSHSLRRTSQALQTLTQQTTVTIGISTSTHTENGHPISLSEAWKGAVDQALEVHNIRNSNMENTVQELILQMQLLQEEVHFHRAQQQVAAPGSSKKEKLSLQKPEEISSKSQERVVALRQPSESQSSSSKSSKLNNPLAERRRSLNISSPSTPCETPPSQLQSPPLSIEVEEFEDIDLSYDHYDKIDGHTIQDENTNGERPSRYLTTTAAVHMTTCCVLM